MWQADALLSQLEVPFFILVTAYSILLRLRTLLSYCPYLVWPLIIHYFLWHLNPDGLRTKLLLFLRPFTHWEPSVLVGTTNPLRLWLSGPSSKVLTLSLTFM